MTIEATTAAPTDVIETFPYPDDDKRARYDASQAASARATVLTVETGLDHKTRKDADGLRYIVYQVPFVEPDAPWTEDNMPERRKTDWVKLPTQIVALGDMLIEAVRLRPTQWLFSNELPKDPAGFVRDLQAGLDKQYGRGRYWANRHGARVYVQCRYPAVDFATAA